MCDLRFMLRSSSSGAGRSCTMSGPGSNKINKLVSVLCGLDWVGRMAY